MKVYDIVKKRRNGTEHGGAYSDDLYNEFHPEKAVKVTLS